MLRSGLYVVHGELKLVDVPAALDVSARVDIGASWVAGDRVDALISLRNSTKKTARAALNITPAGVAALVRSSDASMSVPIPAMGATKVADRAKRIQTLLGDHQDSVVSRLHLSQQAALAHAAGEDTFTYGLLYQQEDDRAQRWEGQLEGALRKLREAVRKS